MKAFNITVIHESAPMIVAKAQEELVERMDPGFWDPKYVDVTKQLLDFGAIPLREIAERPVSGYRSGKLEYKAEGPIAIVKVGDILNTGVDWSQVDFLEETSPANTPNRRINQGDILICRSGEGGAGRGKLCLAYTLKFPSCVHGHVYRMGISKGLSPYVVIFLKTKFGQLQIQRCISGVGVPELDADDILNFLIAYPSEPIPRRVAEEYTKLGEYHSRAIEAKSKMLKARKHGNTTAAERYQVEYERNLKIARAMLNDLIRQVEEIIEGKRTEIEPVDCILKENQS